MKKARGFKLGRKFVMAINWVHRPKHKKSEDYKQLDPPSCKTKTTSKIYNWVHSLKRGAKRLCCSKLDSGYTRVGWEPFDGKPVAVPKGHLAVYVGQKDDDPHRLLVPVIYFNHPLFAELLRKAEEYEFNYPGGITIPCQLSEFEKVKTKIAAGEGCRKRRWKRLI